MYLIRIRKVCVKLNRRIEFRMNNLCCNNYIVDLKYYHA